MRPERNAGARDGGAIEFADAYALAAALPAVTAGTSRGTPP